MSSTSGTQSSNVLNDAFPAGGGLSMEVVANSRMNEARAATGAAAPVIPNVLNDSFPVVSGLSMRVVKNEIMNEA